MPGSDKEQDSQKVNQLSENQLQKIADKAGEDDAPRVNKTFQVNSKDIKQGEDEDGNPVYKVPISGDAFDRDGDQVAMEGRDAMVEQLRSGKIPVYGDHGRSGLNQNIIGQFIDGEHENIDNQEINEGEKVTLATMRVRTEHEDGKELQKLLDGDWPVGFSIGFRPTKVDEIHEDGELVGLKILDMDLLEASAVGIPSQPDSVPVGISSNSTEAAVAVKGFLDEKGGEVDIDGLKDTLENSISKDDNMGKDSEDDGKDPGDTPGNKDSNPEEENDGQNQAEQVKDLVKEAMEEAEKSPHYAKTLKEELKAVEKFDDDELQEIMNVVGNAVSRHMDAAMEEVAEELSTDDDDGDGDGEENGSDGDGDDDDGEEENSGDSGEENDGGDDGDKGLDDDQMTNSDNSTGPKGTGPMTTGKGEDGDGPEKTELSDEISDDELEELGFGKP